MKNIIQNNTKPSLKSKALIKQHRDQVTQEIFTYKQRIDDSYFRMSKCAKADSLKWNRVQQRTKNSAFYEQKYFTTMD